MEGGNKEGVRRGERTTEGRADVRTSTRMQPKTYSIGEHTHTFIHTYTRTRTQPDIRTYLLHARP